jgi:hypothetical protein
MPRRYAVLNQFVIDLDRLLTEAESGFRELAKATNPDQNQVLKLFRPIHSLKGICGMVEEAKLLVRAFHLLEDVLPPLLPVRPSKKALDAAWVEIAEGTLHLARETEKILRRKLELWRELGAHENESRGLVVSFTHDSAEVRLWVPVTSLLGLATTEELESDGLERDHYGVAHAGGEALLVEIAEASICLRLDAIHSTCTRLDAVRNGVPLSVKEWWSSLRKSRSRAA